MNIGKFLQEHPWAQTIQYYDTVVSTNSMLQQQAVSGAPEGTVIFADTQSGGMGRLGRSFHSPAGAGIYMSVLLRPQCRPEQLMHLTCAVAVATCKAIEKSAGMRVQIKWVNDLIYGHKKLAGILTKLSVDPKTGLVNWAIVGIGINCAPAAFPPQLQDIVTSLENIAGKPIDREALAAELVRQLEKMRREMFACKAQIMAYYRQNCAVIGEDVYLIRGEERKAGRVLDVDEDGGLVVKAPDGAVYTVNSGEISLRWANN